jgi:hypothetical protein
MRSPHIHVGFYVLVTLGLIVALPALPAAQIGPEPTPILRAKPDPDRLGKCPDRERPQISFSLDPERPCPGDTVTLRWQVRDRRQGVAWAHPVTITSPPGLPVDIPDPAGNKGSESFTAVAGVLRAGGEFTLATLCGKRTLAWEVLVPPHVDEVQTLAGERITEARQGTLVRLVGRGFGDPGDDTRPLVDFLREGENAVRLKRINFSDTELTVMLPRQGDMEPGRGTFEVTAGCASNAMPFEVRQ